jgi:hypothetical protein
MTQTEETQEENEFPYSQHPHEYAGSNSERQSVGDPGHCEACCSVGHVVAHPDLGCGDVGCDSDHVGEDLPDPPPLSTRVREPDDLPEPYAGDVTWPDVEDVDDMPIAAQFEEAMSALMNQADAATERIETLYRNGIREIRELVRGS